MEQFSKENLSWKPMTVRSWWSLRECQKDRGSNPKKGNWDATGNGNIVKSADRSRATARERGTLSHSPEHQATNQLWSNRVHKACFIDEAHQFVSWRNIGWFISLKKKATLRKTRIGWCWFQRLVSLRTNPWHTTVRKNENNAFPNGPADSNAANLPLAWCPKYQQPDDAASDDAKGVLVGMAASIETSLTRLIRHRQNCQQTENGPVVAGAHWRANPLRQGCLAGALNQDVDVALINYDSLKRKRLH